MGEHDHLRAGDAEREAVVRRLNEAFGEGRLDVAELEERVTRAYQARTLGELRPLTADLPSPAAESVVSPLGAAPAPAVPGPREVRDLGERARRGTVAAWLSASLVNLGIWAAVCVGNTHWVYPWWIWVAGPWGAVILAGEVARRVSR